MQQIILTTSLPLVLLVSYMAIGFFFALGFITYFIGIIDIHARKASFGFRLMILPASILLWPLVISISIGKLSLIIYKNISTHQKESEVIKANNKKSSVPLIEATKPPFTKKNSGK